MKERTLEQISKDIEKLTKNLEKTEEKKKKVSKTQKFFAKKAIKKIKKAKRNKKLEKEIQKGTQQEKKLKERCIQCLLEMSQDFNIYEKDQDEYLVGEVPILVTKEYLETETLEQLEERLDEAVSLIETALKQ